MNCQGASQLSFEVRNVQKLFVVAELYWREVAKPIGDYFVTKCLFHEHFTSAAYNSKTNQLLTEDF